MPSRWAKIGQNGDVNHAFFRIPNKREQNQKWLPHPCFLGGPKEGKFYVNPAFSGIPNATRGEQSEVVPNKIEQNQKWLPHPCLLGNPKEGRNATSPLHSQGSPTKITKIQVATSALPFRGPSSGRKCYVTSAFLEIAHDRRGEQNQKWSPTKGNKIRSGPQQRGTEAQVASSPLPF